MIRLDAECDLTRMAVGDTPHSPSVRPSGANMCVQSKVVLPTSSLFGSSIVKANSTAAAMTSSVNTDVNVMRGQMIRVTPEPYADVLPSTLYK